MQNKGAGLVLGIKNDQHLKESSKVAHWGRPAANQNHSKGYKSYEKIKTKSCETAAHKVSGE